MNAIIWIILLTLLPFLELRYSIPAGIITGKVLLPFGLSLTGFGLNWPAVFFIAVITNIILGLVLYFLLDKVIHYFLHFKYISKIYHKTVEKSQKKIKKYVDKYGFLGIAIFISIPLPGSGVYSAAIGSYALGLNFKDFAKATIIGVTVAGVIVTALTLGVLAI